MDTTCEEKYKESRIQTTKGQLAYCRVSVGTLTLTLEQRIDYFYYLTRSQSTEIYLNGRKCSIPEVLKYIYESDKYTLFTEIDEDLHKYSTLTALRFGDTPELASTSSTSNIPLDRQHPIDATAIPHTGK